jgi:hypothetical protein
MDGQCGSRNPFTMPLHRFSNVATVAIESDDNRSEKSDDAEVSVRSVKPPDPLPFAWVFFGQF